MTKFLDYAGLQTLISNINARFARNATTLGGYGITDAKIEGGVITLGNNTITPATLSNGKILSSQLPSYVDSVLNIVDIVPCYYYSNSMYRPIEYGTLKADVSSSDFTLSVEISPLTNVVYKGYAGSSTGGASNYYKWNGTQYELFNFPEEDRKLYKNVDTDDIYEINNGSLSAYILEDNKIYISVSDNKTYRSNGSSLVEISSSLALGETAQTAYRGDRGAIAYSHATDANRLTTAQVSGLYKIATTAEGHIANITAVKQSDFTSSPLSLAKASGDRTLDFSANDFSSTSVTTGNIHANQLYGTTNNTYPILIPSIANVPGVNANHHLVYMTELDGASEPGRIISITDTEINNLFA